MTGIQREEAKVKLSVKAAAKRGDLGNAKTLAKELVRSRKAVNRMHTSKATMNSVVMQMENQLGVFSCLASIHMHAPTAVTERHSIHVMAAQVKMTGSMAKSSQVMAHMNRLVKVGDIAQTMQEMQKEMMKVRGHSRRLQLPLAYLNHQPHLPYPMQVLLVRLV